MFISPRRALALSAFALAVPALSLQAQTFRGALTGTVTDPSGAAVPNATVQLFNPATNETLSIKSNGAGDFNYPELPVGTYKLTVTMPGFQTSVTDRIEVQVSIVKSLKIVLPIGSESEVVDVQANGVQTDTVSSSLVSVVDQKSVQDIPLNGRDFIAMVKLAPGVSPYRTNSVNGSRSNGINYQIDGADNNDPWSNQVASNQGGVAGIPGGLIPIEAIDQFSLQSSGESDQGRNGGANSNMVMRSGTNHFHGDVFYFDRNEYFAWLSPVRPLHSRVPEIRNHQGGFTLGGPIWKDHTFLFLAGEIQIANANNSIADTVVNNAWVADATAMLRLHNQTPNAVSTRLYNLLFPADSKGGTATTGNYQSAGRNTYNSYNGVIKLDHHFSDREQLSARYLGTTGTQSADVGSHYSDYFQTAPMHIHNWSVIQNSTLSNNIVNQATAGVGYFLQTFNDRNQNFNTQGTGLNLGLAGILASGATMLNIGSFDYTGATPPLGRTDVTGHIVDTLHITLGKHSFKVGGEYRHANVNVGYYTNGRGKFTFDGTRGPWTNADCTTLGYNVANSDTSGHNCSALKQVADFVAGTPQGTSGATILRNNPQRAYIVNGFDVYAQDDFKINNRLNVNYGLRWGYPGTITDDRSSLYNFSPDVGFFQAPLYNRNLGNVAPRVGFSFQPFAGTANTVIRGAYGWFFDQPTVGQFVYNNIGNTGATGIYSNPAGSNPVFAPTVANVTFQSGVNIFPTTLTSTSRVGALAINRNYRAAYYQNFNLNIEQQFTKNTLATIAYVGSLGRRLAYVSDINQIPVVVNANGTQTVGPRPLATAYPTLLAVNQVNSGVGSNYSSLQLSLRQANWHGISATAYYTWSHMFDYTSSTTTPMNSYNLRADYGPSTNDLRNNFTGFASYVLPKFTNRMERLTNGYQFNAIYQFSGGTPINILIGVNADGTGENKDRPNRVPGAATKLARTETDSTTARTFSYLNKTAWASPCATTTSICNTYGNERRDSVTGPGFGSIDFSAVKHTRLSEHVMTELRAEIFNIANQANFANPTASLSSSSFGQLTQTRNGSSAPGLGAGEPRNMQFAFKVSF